MALRNLRYLLLKPDARSATVLIDAGGSPDQMMVDEVEA
jgi:hypothetical protein